jgi:hypothetical protein
MASPARAAVPPSPAAAEPTYEDDLYAWSLRQAEHLRAGNFGALDLQRLAEEIEDVGKSEFRVLESALIVLIHHMLKWDRQPDKRTRSLALTIREQRLRIEASLRESPSLKARWSEATDSAYRYAVGRVEKETGIRIRDLPVRCPYNVADIRERPFEQD